MTILSCKVHSFNEMTKNIYRVRLIPDSDFSFRAGQYLFLIMNELNKKLPFSLASPTQETSFIELHIGAYKQHLFAMTVIDNVINNKTIIVDIPQGEAWLRDDTERPIVLIACGTGFSYARSIMLTVLEYQPYRVIYIYWIGKTIYHLYNLNELQELSKKYSTLTIVPIVEQPDKKWQGRTGSVLSAVINDYNNLSDYDIYIASSFDMANDARKLFCKERNASINRIYSDAFAFI
ncbi:NAD(P)H-flavin reductase [Candidatus Palibaumannia cicadellinicola]|uniref:NAD(P)H-flavin reductase n=1 Tax=Candidatus Palibaumannia cicadellinicola TaxID=186490 RepID=A0A0K2BKE2_9GAMM|nr:NAD(P)H-flavin reductase [Candidatus Baumannia cicadellinicola]AKZ65672.1 NAD(P)H-flavin reductase [Candidatus Baumannia cicadellinicola]